MELTPEDIAQLKRAKINIATGKNVTSVKFSSGKQVDYGPGDLPNIDSLIRQSRKPRSKGVYIVSRKGF